MKETLITLVFIITFKSEPTCCELDDVAFNTMALKFIDDFGIRSVSLITDNSKAEQTLSDYRVFSQKTLTRVLAQNDLYAVIMLENKQSFRNLFLLKQYDEKGLHDFMRSLYKTNKMHLISNHHWLLFFNGPMRAGQNVVFGTFESNVLIVRRHEKGFLLQRMFNLKKKIMKVGYSIWDASAGRFGMMEKGEINMNRTTFLSYTAGASLKDCERSIYYRHKQCLYAKLFEDMTEHLNFRFVEITHKNFEMHESDDVDMMLNAEIITSDTREKLYTFVKSYPMEKLQWFLKYTTMESKSNIYYRPFTNQMWAAVGVSSLLSGLSCTAIQYADSFIKKSGRNFNAANLIFMGFDSLLNQGCEGLDYPAMKMAHFFSSFLSMFVVPAYGGDLTAFLSARIIKLPFKDLKGFVELKKFKLLVHNATYLDMTLKTNEDPLWQRIRSNNLTETYNTSKEGLDKLCSEAKLVFPIFIIDTNVKAATCQLSRISKPITTAMAVIRLGKGEIHSPFNKLLNKYFLKFLESGVVNKIELVDRLEDEFQSSYEYIPPVEIQQIWPLLNVILIGGTMALFLLLGEIGIAKFRVKTRRMAVSNRRSHLGLGASRLVLQLHQRP